MCEACRFTLKTLKIKMLIVEYLGGKCSICGYNKEISALDCHHNDGKEKEFSICNRRSSNINTLKSELDKCILLCSNCHRERHANTIGRRQQVIEYIKSNNKSKDALTPFL